MLDLLYSMEKGLLFQQIYQLFTFYRTKIRVVACLYRGVVLYNSRVAGICTEEWFYITIG